MSESIKEDIILRISTRSDGGARLDEYIAKLREMERLEKRQGGGRASSTVTNVGNEAQKAGKKISQARRELDRFSQSAGRTSAGGAGAGGAGAGGGSPAEAMAQNAKILDDLSARKIGSYVQTTKSGVKELTEVYRGASGQLIKVNTRTNVLRESMTKMGDSISNVIKKVGLWMLGTTLVIGSIRGLQSMLKTFTEVEAETFHLMRVGRGFGESQEEIAKGAVWLRDELMRLKVELGSVGTQAFEAAITFARLGMTEREVAEATRVALLAQNIAEMGAADAAKYLAAAMTQFKLSVADLPRVLDEANALSNKYRVTTQDLFESVAVAGAIYRDAGGSLEQLMATTAAVAQATGKTGKEIGNAFKTIASRIHSASHATTVFRITGVRLRELDGSLKPINQALGEVIASFGKLTDAQKADVSQALAGIRQRNVLTVALDTYYQAQMAILRQYEDVNSAERENELSMETLKKQTDQMTASFEQLGTAGFGAIQGPLKNLVDAIASTVTGMNESGISAVVFAAALTALVFILTNFILKTMLAKVASSGLVHSFREQYLVAIANAQAIGTLSRAYVGLKVAANMAANSVRGLSAAGKANIAILLISLAVAGVTALKMLGNATDEAIERYNAKMREMAEGPRELHAKGGAWKTQAETIDTIGAGLRVSMAVLSEMEEKMQDMNESSEKYAANMEDAKKSLMRQVEKPLQFAKDALASDTLTDPVRKKVLENMVEQLEKLYDMTKSTASEELNSVKVQEVLLRLQKLRTESYSEYIAKVEKANKGEKAIGGEHNKRIRQLEEIKKLMKEHLADDIRQKEIQKKYSYNKETKEELTALKNRMEKRKKLIESYMGSAAIAAEGGGVIGFLSGEEDVAQSPSVFYKDYKKFIDDIDQAIADTKKKYDDVSKSIAANEKAINEATKAEYERLNVVDSIRSAYALLRQDLKTKSLFALNPKEDAANYISGLKKEFNKMGSNAKAINLIETGDQGSDEYKNLMKDKESRIREINDFDKDSRDAKLQAGLISTETLLKAEMSARTAVAKERAKEIALGEAIEQIGMRILDVEKSQLSVSEKKARLGGLYEKQQSLIEEKERQQLAILRAEYDLRRKIRDEIEKGVAAQARRKAEDAAAVYRTVQDKMIDVRYKDPYRRSQARLESRKAELKRVQDEIKRMVQDPALQRGKAGAPMDAKDKEKTTQYKAAMKREGELRKKITEDQYKKEAHDKAKTHRASTEVELEGKKKALAELKIKEEELRKKVEKPRRADVSGEGGWLDPFGDSARDAAKSELKKTQDAIRAQDNVVKQARSKVEGAKNSEAASGAGVVDEAAIENSKTELKQAQAEAASIKSELDLMRKQKDFQYNTEYEKKRGLYQAAVDREKSLQSDVARGGGEVAVSILDTVINRLEIEKRITEERQQQLEQNARELAQMDDVSVAKARIMAQELKGAEISAEQFLLMGEETRNMMSKFQGVMPQMEDVGKYFGGGEMLSESRDQIKERYQNEQRPFSVEEADIVAKAIRREFPELSNVDVQGIARGDKADWEEGMSPHAGGVGIINIPINLGGVETTIERMGVEFTGIIQGLFNHFEVKLEDIRNEVRIGQGEGTEEITP